MAFNTSLPARDSIQNLCHPMTDIIFHNVPHEPSRQEDTHHRVNQIKVVRFRSIEIISEEILYRMDKELQNQCSKCCENTYKKTENQNKLLLLNVVFTPTDKTLESE